MLIHPGVDHRLQNLSRPGLQFVVMWAKFTWKVLCQPVQKKGWYWLYSEWTGLPVRDATFIVGPGCSFVCTQIVAGILKAAETMFACIFLLHRYYIFIDLCSPTSMSKR